MGNTIQLLTESNKSFYNILLWDAEDKFFYKYNIPHTEFFNTGVISIEIISKFKKSKELFAGFCILTNVGKHFLVPFERQWNVDGEIEVIPNIPIDDFIVEELKGYVVKLFNEHKLDFNSILQKVGYFNDFDDVYLKFRI